MTKSLSAILVFVLLLSGCNILQKSARQELSAGFYTKNTGNEKQKVYVNVAEDSILIYPAATPDKSIAVDTAKPAKFYLSEFKDKKSPDFSLSKGSFDIDLITMPVKFRSAENNVPPQLNSELNISAFLGYRKDKYSIKYKTNPLHIHERKILHIGYSVGLFTGIGNTFVSPTTTNDQMQQEYDGIVWSKGVAGIIGLNSFSVGIALGFDNLLDDNNTVWIYENKPWVGLALGINLN